jgi:hypothetical protein
LICLFPAWPYLISFPSPQFLLDSDSSHLVSSRTDHIQKGKNDIHVYTTSQLIHCKAEESMKILTRPEPVLVNRFFVPEWDFNLSKVGADVENWIVV